MASRSNSLHISSSGLLAQAGFTLLEIMLVMAFIAIVGAFGLIYGLESLRQDSFYSERSLLISALQHARSLAVGNTCLGSGCTDGRPHGVSIQNDKYVVFEGASYALRDASVDEAIPANSVVTHSFASCGGLKEVVFTQLSATSTGCEIGLYDAVGHVSSTTVGKEGEIRWSK